MGQFFTSHSAYYLEILSTYSFEEITNVKSKKIILSNQHQRLLFYFQLNIVNYLQTDMVEFIDRIKDKIVFLKIVLSIRVEFTNRWCDYSVAT